jgi:hypothetical protein
VWSGTDRVARIRLASESGHRSTLVADEFEVGPLAGSRGRPFFLRRRWLGGLGVVISDATALGRVIYGAWFTASDVRRTLDGYREGTLTFRGREAIAFSPDWTRRRLRVFRQDVCLNAGNGCGLWNRRIGIWCWWPSFC